MKLLVLANEFPYGQTEPYMETEEKYYSRFKKVWIASLQLRKKTAETVRELKSGANIIPVKYMPRIFYLFNCLTILGDINLYKEINYLRNTKKISKRKIIDLFVFLSRAHHEARIIDRALKGENKSDILLYSYRFEYQPYVAILLKKKWKTNCSIVSRAHGYDLYEEQHKNNYIPLRSIIIDNLDRVYPCSNFGTQYISEKSYSRNSIIQTRYLGTVDHGVRLFKNDKNVLRILSCSNVNAGKRIEKIINALSLIDDIPYEWTHYGGGDLYEGIKEKANVTLGNKAILPGNISNKELLEHYTEENFFVFINVSSSEGLPVSIMEAMSVGIPCIATNVGGTKEIVNSSNGILLPANVSDEEIANAIRKLYEIRFTDYLRLRENARQFWNEKFNADSNYSEFIDELLSINISD